MLIKATYIDKSFESIIIFDNFAVMKLFYLLLISLLLFNPTNAQVIQDFPYWLAGTWEIETEYGKSYEEWTKYDDKTLLGKTFRIIDTDTLVFDNMKIEYSEKGIMLEMSVFLYNSQAKVKYKMEKIDSELWRFENPLIEFPLSINYLKTSENTAYLWTEAKNDNISCTDFIMIRKNE